MTKEYDDAAMRLASAELAELAATLQEVFCDNPHERIAELGRDGVMMTEVARSWNDRISEQRSELERVATLVIDIADAYQRNDSATAQIFTDALTPPTAPRSGPTHN